MAELTQILDGPRRVLLRGLLSVRPLRAIFIDPRRRIPVAGVVAVISSAALALGAPLISLWLGAALLGVPHVLSGVRHVAVRGRVERGTRACVVAAIAVGAAQIAGAGAIAVPAFVALFAVAAAIEILAAKAPAWRALVLLSIVVAAAAAGMARPALFLLVMTHLHAASSVAYLALRSRRRGIPAWPLLAATAAVVACCALGLVDRLFPSVLWAPRSAVGSILLEATGAATTDAHAVASATLLHRALFLYAFGQALHFAIWLRLMPEVDRDSPVPHSFRRAFALLRADLGRLAVPAIVIALAAAPLILVGGGAAREAYFAITYFHFGLEAAALTRMVARAPVAGTERSTAPTLYTSGIRPEKSHCPSRLSVLFRLAEEDEARRGSQ